MLLTFNVTWALTHIVVDRLGNGFRLLGHHADCAGALYRIDLLGVEVLAMLVILPATRARGSAIHTIQRPRSSTCHPRGPIMSVLLFLRTGRVAPRTASYRRRHSTSCNSMTVAASAQEGPLAPSRRRGRG